MNKLFSLFALLLSANCFAQNTPGLVLPQRMVTFKNPSSLSVPKGYSQAAEIDMGASKMIIMAGQVSLDKNGNLVGKDDLAKQVNQCFLNIKTIVEDAGGNMDNVVKLNYYIKDVSKAPLLRQIRDKYINTKTP